MMPEMDGFTVCRKIKEDPKLKDVPVIFLTAKGGVSSHAALVARQMGKVCVCGAAALQIDYAAKTMTVKGVTYNEGDFLSINGTAGEVYAGNIPTAASEIVQVLVEKYRLAERGVTATTWDRERA